MLTATVSGCSVPYIAPTIQNNNTVTNVDVGMGSFAGASDDRHAGVYDEHHRRAEQSPSTGFYITNTTWYYGLTDVSTTFTGNIIENNVDGVVYRIRGGLYDHVQRDVERDRVEHGDGGATAAVPAAYRNPGDLPGTLVVHMVSNWWGNPSTVRSTRHQPLGHGNSIDNGLDYSSLVGG